MQEDESSDVLVLFYCAADGDPQQLCCVHSIPLQPGAVGGSRCDRGEGRACCLVLTKKDPHSGRPSLTYWAILYINSEVQHCGIGLQPGNLREIISHGCNVGTLLPCDQI